MPEPVPGAAWLIAAGVISIAAALAHLACIVGGPVWFRAMGAGERLARGAERGDVRPALVAGAVAAVLFVWAAIAFSAAGLIPALPLTGVALVAISAVLLVRGLAVPVMQKWRPDLPPSFIYGSAAIVTAYGLIFAIGTWHAWPTLWPKGNL